MELALPGPHTAIEDIRALHPGWTEAECRAECDRLAMAGIGLPIPA